MNDPVAKDNFLTEILRCFFLIGFPLKSILGRPLPGKISAEKYSFTLQLCALHVSFNEKLLYRYSITEFLEITVHLSIWLVNIYSREGCVLLSYHHVYGK